MIINGQALLDAAPIKNMEPCKKRLNGVSYGLAEAGYDIRIKQGVTFKPYSDSFVTIVDGSYNHGRFTIASAIEEFQMPNNLVGLVKDKSTWARRGLSVFNTVIEPGWNGFLTLELVYHGQDVLEIPPGTGIAQVIFQSTELTAAYNGKYQNQADQPVSAILEDDFQAGAI